MYRQLLSVSRYSLRPLCRYVPRTGAGRGIWRTVATTPDYESKYANKLGQRAKEAGLSIDELKAKIKQEQAEETLRRRKEHEAQAALAQHTSAQVENVKTAEGSPNSTASAAGSSALSGRKDGSPVKPLSTIFNLQKIMATPHTAEQVGTIWTAYHLSKSAGTGRGYVCASIPLELYNKMTAVGQRHSSFVVPVPRAVPPETTDGEAKKGEETTAYEFYFLQWDFHDSPPVPKETEDLFTKPGAESESGSNPRTSTVLFTPLQEYKMRAAFATPYLVLTHYTDLASTHGVVLLRGEITPASASAGGGAVDGRYMLTQEDAQLLSMALQKFYLWNSDGSGEGERLLKCFHQTPEDFKWEDLLQYANKTTM